MCILKRVSKRQTPGNGFTPHLGSSRSLPLAELIGRVGLRSVCWSLRRNARRCLFLVTAVDNEAGTFDGENVIHGSGALQEQGCDSRISPLSRQRANGTRRPVLCLQLGR